MTAMTVTPSTPVTAPAGPARAPRRQSAVCARPCPDGKAVISDHTHPDT
jgi:hypothetical protein